MGSPVEEFRRAFEEGTTFNYKLKGGGYIYYVKGILCKLDAKNNLYFAIDGKWRKVLNGERRD